MKMLWIAGALGIAAAAASAADRFAIEPSLQINTVADDNLNFSIDNPLSDRVNRLSPALALRLSSPRWRVFGAYALDSERYQTYTTLDSNAARQRASVGFEFDCTPRLTLSMAGNYLDTNTLADLNTDTGLASARVHGRRLSFAPSASLRLSPRVNAHLEVSSSATNEVQGVATRTDNERLAFEKRATLHDRLAIDYEHTNMIFTGSNNTMVQTHVLLAGWTHSLSLHNQIVLQAGPRMTDGKASADVAASIAHTTKASEMAISFTRTQSTVVGYAGVVDTDSLQGHLTLAPWRRLSAYVGPAVILNTHNDLRARVLRGSAGIRWAITSLLDAEAIYNHEVQSGGIDPLRADARLSHSTFSIGLSTHRSSR